MLKVIFSVCCLIGVTVSEAAQIYRCKTHQGAFYWASDWCSKTGSNTVDIVTVPDGMSFQDQARIGDQLINNKQTTAANEDRARGRARTCGAIDSELAQIWSRYNNWQFNQADQISRDQIRTRELKSQRAQLGCETR